MVRTCIAVVSISLVLFVFSGISGAQDSSKPIDFGQLLNEMQDLSALARWPQSEYTTVQFSSYDRRSVSPDAEGWYSNSDGFGKEPIPGVAEVLEAPGEDGIGLYLIADVKGPGAVVRGWSAAMDGVMKAYIDGSEAPFFTGKGYDFMARKSVSLLKNAGSTAGYGDAFCQQDADYLPIPFAKSFRVTWRGNLQRLHFYHLEFRRYASGTKLISFDPKRDPSTHRDTVQKVADRLTHPDLCAEGKAHDMNADLAPGKTWEWETPEPKQSGAIIGFTLNIAAKDAAVAWRGTLLRIAFDGAHKPQVESPAGDFFGSAVGLNPFNSLPMAAFADGSMTCRFVMPYREGARITLYNSTNEAVTVTVRVTLMPWQWDERSLYFKAKWRTVNHIDMHAGPFDIPYLMACGQGRFVGAACMLANPSPIPHPYGSWWGEGDEKIFVDDTSFPVFFGTGSEDYYNYSWSRPDLFDHPYCGQPLDSGPGNAGYCSNHRWHILDNLLFKNTFAFYMEMWPHSGRAGLCYSSMAYFYTKPGTIDDHRRVQLSELVVPELPSMQPEAGFGANGASFHVFEKMGLDVEGGRIGFDDTQVVASQGRLVTWTAKLGDRLSVTFPVKEANSYAVNLVAAHWPQSGSIQATLGDTSLIVANLGGAMLGQRDSSTLTLKSTFTRRLLNTGFKPVSLTPGEHTLTLECVEAGRFGLDYLWLR